LAVDEFHLFETVFDIIYPNLPAPDIIIFLYCSIDQLHHNIRKRARSYEQEIPSDYLSKIQDSYNQYLRSVSVPVLMIDSSSIDFYNNEDFNKILKLLHQQWEAGVHYVEISS
jgi:deoxyadenosine/deoxycytidine kinase